MAESNGSSEQKIKVSILTVCGTSLGENFKEWLRERGEGTTDYKAKIGNEDFKKFLTPLFSNLTGSCLQNLDSIKFPSAEIQSLFLLFETDSGFKNDQVFINRIYLYHAEDEGSYGKQCAEEIQNIIKKARNEYKNGLIWDNNTKIVLKSYTLHDISKESDFRTGVSELVKLIEKDIGDSRKDSGRIILNITGGYKAITPFPFLLGLMETGVETIYTYEENRQSVIKLPRLPLDWEYRFIDEYRAIFKQESPTLSKEVYEKLPPRLKDLFHLTNSSYSLNAFGQIVGKSYAAKGLRRFGYGAPLLERLSGDLQEKLTGLVDNWEHLWIGDQVPETVEHSRKHSLRLLEMANYIFDFTDVQLDEHALYALIAAFWLHDVGHAGLRYKINGDITINTAEFPSLVRDWHSLLSYQRIVDKNYLEDTDASKAVALISKYHRGEMPLQGKECWVDPIFKLELPPLERVLNLNKERLKVNGKELSKEKALLVAALLRLVDGCDAQADRVVDDIYLEARKARTDEEIEYYLETLMEEKILWCLLDSNWCRRLDKIYGGSIEFVTTYKGLTEKWIGMTEDEKKTLKQISRNLQDECLKLLHETFINTKISFEEKEIIRKGTSILDRIIFKKEQERHFIKHSGVKLVYFAKGNTDSLDVILAGEESRKADMNGVAKDIYEEYKEVADILDLAGVRLGRVIGVFEDGKTETLYPTGAR